MPDEYEDYLLAFLVNRHKMCRYRRRRRVASSGHLIASPCPDRMACLSVSRGWQGQIQCRCGVDLSSEREDDQDDVSSPHQVNDRMLGRLGNVERCVLKSPVWAELCLWTCLIQLNLKFI